MAEHKIRKGLDLPITGDPEQVISKGKPVDRVAIIAADYVGMKPKFFCKVGDPVKRGQPIFEDRKNPGVLYTALATGNVVAIHRGAKRALQSVVIELSENERSNTLTDNDYHGFESYSGKQDLDVDELEKLLVESGAWTLLKARPYGRVPEPGSRPDCLFLTCTDTEPLSPDINVVIEGREEDFKIGATALAKLAKQKTYLCVHPKSDVPTDIPQTQLEIFSGKHPAGLAGTHIHFLYPVSRKRSAWSVHLQDIVAIGHLIRTGKLDLNRVISLAGPPVEKPRLISARLGSNTNILADGEHPEGDYRIISGSAISGRTAMGDIHGYLGANHRQITILREGKEREFIGWLLPGSNRFSTIPAFLSALFPGKKYAFSTSTNGEHREMVPIGMYERIMPLDIIPTFLLRALEIGDLERAEKLGALELDEEDLALCSFVCPGKQDYGEHLRKVLDQIHKEG